MKRRNDAMEKLYKSGGTKGFLIKIHKDVGIHIAATPLLNQTNLVIQRLISNCKDFAEQKFGTAEFSPGSTLEINAEEAVALILEFSFENNASQKLEYCLIRNNAQFMLQNFSEEKLLTYAHYLSESNGK